jgi:hypothetical protein
LRAARPASARRGLSNKTRAARRGGAYVDDLKKCWWQSHIVYAVSKSPIRGFFDEINQQMFMGNHTFINSCNVCAQG